MNAANEQSFDRQAFVRDRAKVVRNFWGKVRRNFVRLPFAEELVAAYYCAIDKSTPLQVKATLMAALAYFVVPTDLLPDWIALLGYTDDAAVLFAAYRMVANHITEAHRALARKAVEEIRREQPTSATSGQNEKPA